MIGHKNISKHYITILFIICSIFNAHSVNCAKCHGTGEIDIPCKAHCHYGKVSCNLCYGKGTRKEDCSYCSSGYITKEVKKRCYNCTNGNISITDSTPCGSCRNGQRPTTYNGRTVYQTCTICHGAGTKTITRKATCPVCRGSKFSGTEIKKEKCSYCSYGYIERECKLCSGGGKLDCKRCYGNGIESKTCDICFGSGKR